MNNMIIHKGTVYRPFSNDLFEGHEPVKIPEGNPTMRWKGHRIPLNVWYSIVKFFREHHEHECMVRLYYHAQHGWRAWAWPQKYGTGMTIKEIENHPLRSTQWNEQFGPGWDCAGTVHHHCKAGAFQSGTDHADELGFDGIHITLGKMDEARLDYHGRTSYGGGFWDAPIVAWFAVPDVVRQLPPRVWDDVMRFYVLEELPADTTYPPEWKTNLIEEKPASLGYVNYGYDWYKRDYPQLGTPAPATPASATPEDEDEYITEQEFLSTLDMNEYSFYNELEACRYFDTHEKYRGKYPFPKCDLHGAYKEHIETQIWPDFKDRIALTRAYELAEAQAQFEYELLAQEEDEMRQFNGLM